MSEQQPYTPTWDKVREHYYLGRQQFDDPMYPAGSVTEIVAEFDQWHAAEIAAAEQRGAVKALAKSKRWLQNGGWIELNQRITLNGTSDSMAQITVIWLGEQIEQYRADQIEQENTDA